MTKAQILTLIDTLSLSRADSSSCSSFLDEELEQLSQRSNTLCSITAKATTSGTATYSLDATQGRLLGAFYSTRQLTRSSLPELEAYSSTWRAASDTPRAFTEEVETEDSFHLYPNPNANSASALQLVTTVIPDASYEIPGWLSLILAFRVLSREYARPSDHQDPEFADLCKDYSTLLFHLVKI